MTAPLLTLDAERLWKRIQTLATFTRPEVPWTRRAFSVEFTLSREWLQQEFLEAGLEVTVDAGGNLVGRLPGLEAGLPPLVSGSHSDTVVGGGRFDGIIGVLAALEVAACLNASGRKLRHDLQVIDFLSEEPSDYGVSCVGSRALCGRLEPTMLAATNPDGETLADAIVRVGGNPAALGKALREPDSCAAFVELHIEQGPVLESRALDIGVVTNIVGIRRVALKVTGQPDHAGTTPMDLRRDALAGAAQLITEANRMATRLSGNPHYVVATVGRIAMTPNVPNAVPGVVEMVLEVRSDAASVLAGFPESLLEDCKEQLTCLRVSAQLEELTHGSPTDCSDPVIECIENTARALGLSNVRMPSGAGHDAVYMKHLGPMGMIFVPCLNGRSHCPQEWLEPEQLLKGTQVLAQTLLALDRSLS